jgi:hypothetical protein
MCFTKLKQNCNRRKRLTFGKKEEKNKFTIYISPQRREKHNYNNIKNLAGQDLSIIY